MADLSVLSPERDGDSSNRGTGHWRMSNISRPVAAQRRPLGICYVYGCEAMQVEGCGYVAVSEKAEGDIDGERARTSSVVRQECKRIYRCSAGRFDRRVIVRGVGRKGGCCGKGREGKETLAVTMLILLGTEGAEGMLLVPMQVEQLGTSMTIIVIMIVILFVIPIICKIIHIIRVQVRGTYNHVTL